jgi:hypothetical protein
MNTQYCKKEDTLQDRFDETLHDLRGYGSLQWDALRLKALETLSEFFNTVASSLIVILLGSIALLFLGVLFTVLLADLTGSWLLAVGIMTVVFFVATLVVYLKRRTLLTDSMVRMLSKILFEKKEK